MMTKKPKETDSKAMHAEHAIGRFEMEAVLARAG